MFKIEAKTVRGKSLGQISVTSATTIAEIKQEISRLNSKLPPSRQSLRLSAKAKTEDDKKTVGQLKISNNDCIYVKDLGPQISWRFVFIVEYMGPLLVYLLFTSRPECLYGKLAWEIPMTLAAKIACFAWSLHYAKRLIETIFVHKFSHATMPFFNLFKNSFYYWGFAAWIGYFVNHPKFTPPSELLLIIGAITFMIAEIGNLSIHLALANLRPPGTTIRRIPKPTGNVFTKMFNKVSCPNYTYEFISWIGFSMITSCLPVMVFAAAGLYQMSIWAIGKHKNYIKEFPDYPKGRKAILPGLI